MYHMNTMNNLNYLPSNLISISSTNRKRNSIDNENKQKSVILFFHGYGGNEHHLFNLFYPELKDNYDLISFRAPLKLNSGFYWFPLSQDLNFKYQDITNCINWMSFILKPLEYTYKKIIFLGFSQGMAIANLLANKINDSIVAVIGLSGFIVNIEELNISNAKNRKYHFLWCRDKNDSIINNEKIDYSKNWLKNNSFLRENIYKNIGHNVDRKEIEDIKKFLYFIC